MPDIINNIIIVISSSSSSSSSSIHVLQCIEQKHENKYGINK